MLYIHDTKEIQLEGPSVVTIGKFDGFHLGHRKLLQECCRIRKAGERVVVFTFSRSPQMVLAGKAYAELNSHEEKVHLAEALGVDVLIEYPFTPDVRQMTAENFLKDILFDRLHAVAIVAGPDCRFGYERRGDIEFLEEHSEELGYLVHVVEKENYQLMPISSTRIREVLRKGAIEEVNAMLGCHYGYDGEVVHGRRLGRTLGFPTINQWVPEGKVLPQYGVYASEVVRNGKVYPAVSNIGVKPTISGSERVSIETYIYDFDHEIYGEKIRVQLLHFVRPERRFYSLEALKKQVDRDKIEVQRYHMGRM